MVIRTFTGAKLTITCKVHTYMNITYKYMISAILAFASINDHMMIYPYVAPLLSAYYGSFGMSGGIVSTAADMSKWILFQLAEGKTPDGTEILSDAGFRVSVGCKIVM